MKEMKTAVRCFLAYLSFALIMVALGASDALRGIFAPVFETHFSLNNMQLSLIVTVSYAGNFIFLLSGGRLADQYSIKRVFLGVMAAWMLSLVLYLATDNYYVLLAGMFVSMGASTLMNTMINIMTPMLFAGAPALIVNTLFFTQGIGTTGSQKIAGMYANGIGDWKITNMVLLVIAALGILLFFFSAVPEKERSGQPVHKNHDSYREIIKNPAFFYLILILGFYFVAEHGILNWLVSYSSKALGYSVSESSGHLSIFFGGMMTGRLLFAPVVQRLGILKSITIFGGFGMIFYTAGIAGGKSGMMLLSLAGLFFSILYPTLVTMIQLYYEQSVISTAAGLILSAASLFDVGFNALFGKAIDIFGFKTSFLALPVCMVLFYLCFILFLRQVPEHKMPVRKQVKSPY